MGITTSQLGSTRPPTHPDTPGLIWLTIAAAVLFVATAAWGYVKHRAGDRSAP